MPVSQDPLHVADRHLEKVEALVRILRITADTAGETDWRDARQGLLILSRQIEQQLAEARNAIDAA